MRIGVFAYNFHHKKTQEGLFHLLASGYKIECILAADPVELKFYQSKMRISPKGLFYFHPDAIAKRFSIPYHVVVHNSTACHDLIKKYNLDVGIVLGARILRESVIKSFKIGVLNMHPGLLPENRGLDTIKWAIINNIKQGVSCHMISREIDRGELIMKRPIDVYDDDTLLDIFLRIQNTEQTMMVESLKLIESGCVTEPVGVGNYSRAVPPEAEAILEERFSEYKKVYNSL